MIFRHVSGYRLIRDDSVVDSPMRLRYSKKGLYRCPMEAEIPKGFSQVDVFGTHEIEQGNLPPELWALNRRGGQYEQLPE